VSFYNNNKYYIIQNLQVGMRGLSLEERQIKYNSFSPEIRKRIYQYYLKNIVDSTVVNTTELNSLYNKLFEFVGDFELEYIIANLFFETNFTNIAFYLKNNTVAFNNLIVSPFEPFTFKWLMYLYLNESDFFQSSFFEFVNL